MGEGLFWEGPDLNLGQLCLVALAPGLRTEPSSSLSCSWILAVSPPSSAGSPRAPQRCCPGTTQHTWSRQTSVSQGTQPRRVSATRNDI